MQREQARAGDEEAHFVFLVEVLVEELGAHGLALRVVRRDAHHVHGLEAVLGDEAVKGPAHSLQQPSDKGAVIEKAKRMTAFEQERERKRKQKKQA